MFNAQNMDNMNMNNTTELGGNLAGLASETAQYNPDKQAILDLVNEVQNGLRNDTDVTSKIVMIIFLMSKFSGEVLGLDGQAQDQMNKYLNKAKIIWNDIEAGGTHAKTGNLESEYAALDGKLKGDISQLMNDINNDPFFQDPAHKDLKEALVGSLTNIQDTIFQGDQSDWKNGLYNFWKNYDPSLFNRDPMPPFPMPDPPGPTGTRAEYKEALRNYNDALRKKMEAAGIPAADIPYPPVWGWGTNAVLYDQELKYYKELKNIWKNHDWGNANGPGNIDDENPVQGDPSQMNFVMQDVGQLNQQLTSASQIMQIKAKMHAKTYETTQNIYLAFIQAFDKTSSVITRFSGQV